MSYETFKIITLIICTVALLLLSIRLVYLFVDSYRLKKIQPYMFGEKEWNKESVELAMKVFNSDHYHDRITRGIIKQAYSEVKDNE